MSGFDNLFINIFKRNHSKEKNQLIYEKKYMFIKTISLDYSFNIIMVRMKEYLLYLYPYN